MAHAEYVALKTYAALFLQVLEGCTVSWTEVVYRSVLNCVASIFFLVVEV